MVEVECRRPRRETSVPTEILAHCRDAWMVCTWFLYARGCVELQDVVVGSQPTS